MLNNLFCVVISCTTYVHSSLDFGFSFDSSSSRCALCVLQRGNTMREEVGWAL